MGRRRSSFIDDVIDLTSRLPWWAGVILAVVAYVILYQIATLEVPRPIGGVGAAEYAGKSLQKTVATLGMYLLPMLFLAGALLSAVMAIKRGALYGKVSRTPKVDTLKGVSWREFELLISESFRRQGYQVLDKGGSQPDGGVDLIATRNGERYLVQCKHWRALKVSVNVVRELYGVMAAEGAAGGFVVTSGAFTDEAAAFAAGRNIELIDGPRLLAMIGEARRTLQAAQRSNPPQASSSRTELPGNNPVVQPKCPRCQSPMTKRVAKQGASAGKRFWGCSRFPACKGTLPID